MGDKEHTQNKSSSSDIKILKETIKKRRRRIQEKLNKFNVASGNNEKSSEERSRSNSMSSSVSSNYNKFVQANYYHQRRQRQQSENSSDRYQNPNNLGKYEQEVRGYSRKDEHSLRDNAVIKSKISRVREKLSNFPVKGDSKNVNRAEHITREYHDRMHGAPGVAGSSGVQNRNRSISEGLYKENSRRTDEYTRSISIGCSSTHGSSITDMTSIMGEEKDTDKEQQNKRKDRKRNRVRNKKKQKDNHSDLEDVYDLDVDENLKLNVETLLLLDLLALSPEERDEFIIRTSLQRGIFVLNSETKEIILNPIIIKLHKIMKQNQTVRSYDGLLKKDLTDFVNDYYQEMGRSSSSCHTKENESLNLFQSGKSNGQAKEQQSLGFNRSHQIKCKKPRVIIWCGEKNYPQPSNQLEEGKKEQKEKPPKLDFINLVHEIVWEGLSDQEKQAFSMDVQKKTKSCPDYYSREHFHEKLENFAQKCVDADLGVIVEGEIRVNKKNNDMAFIKQADGMKDAIFTSLLVRQCTLQGDIVKAFIRTLPPKQNNITSEIKTKIEAIDESEQSVQTTLKTDDPTTKEDMQASSLSALIAAADATLREDQVEILPEKSFKAFVIKIVKEVHNRKCIGNFLSYRKNSEYITFIPRDMRLPNLKIFRTDWPKLFVEGKMEKVPDVLYMASIKKWNNDTAIGKILHPIGKCGELEAENTAILLQNGLDVTPYDEKFNQMFYGPLVITENDLKMREDIRSECVFTIDPLTARDLDDAMSCNELPDGNFEIGVHISDVAHFLKEESELDRCVKLRTTSVYLVNEVYHMLPKPLCFKCSLLPGEDKFAFSVFWKMTPNGEVLNTRFARTILNSCTQFAYEHAQKIIDNPQKIFTEKDFPQIHNDFKVEDIVNRIKRLNSIANTLRKRRFDNGALKINRPKLYFDLHPETGEPMNYEVAELQTANFLIEEFMLLANQSVAEIIYEKFPEIAILRNHDAPLNNVIKKLQDRLKLMGLELNISSSKTLYSSMLKLIGESKEENNAMDICLSHLLSKPMTRAKYFCSNGVSNHWHYALSIPIYTHFTSPIRRYPDVLVHRLLGAVLNHHPPPGRNPTELQTIAERCNEMKYNAKLAGEDSANLYFMHYIKSKKFVVFKAAVLELFQHSMETLLIETGHQIRVPYPKDRKLIKLIHVEVENKIPPLSAEVIFTDENGKVTKTETLRVFSETAIEVYVVNGKLKGRFAALPKTNGENNEVEDEEVDPIVPDDKDDTLCREELNLNLEEDESNDGDSNRKHDEISQDRQLSECSNSSAINKNDNSDRIQVQLELLSLSLKKNEETNEHLSTLVTEIEDQSCKKLSSPSTQSAEHEKTENTNAEIISDPSVIEVPISIEDKLDIISKYDDEHQSIIGKLSEMEKRSFPVPIVQKSESEKAVFQATASSSKCSPTENDKTKLPPITVPIDIENQLDRQDETNQVAEATEVLPSSSNNEHEQDQRFNTVLKTRATLNQSHSKSREGFSSQADASNKKSPNVCATQ